MAISEYEAVYRRLVEEGWNQGNEQAMLDELYDEGITVHGAEGEGDTRGLDALKELCREYRTAFPDLQLQVEDLLIQGDKVAARVSWQGTHRGEFLDVAPTGRTVRAWHDEIVRFEGGKMAESWEIVDVMTILRQMGIDRIPEAAG